MLSIRVGIWARRADNESMIRRTILATLATLTAFAAFGPTAHAADVDTSLVPSPCSESYVDDTFEPIAECPRSADHIYVIEGNYVEAGDDAAAYDECRNVGGRVVSERSYGYPRIVCVARHATSAPALPMPVPMRPCFEGHDIFTIEAWQMVIAFEGCQVPNLSGPTSLVLIMGHEGAAARCGDAGGSYEYLNGAISLDICWDVDY